MDFKKASQELDLIERKDEVIFRCRELIRQARDQGNYQFKLFFEAKLNITNGIYDDALHKLKNALELEPHNPIFHLEAGICAANLNLYQEAIIYFDQAISLDVKNIKALINKAGILCKTGDPKRAIIVYDHALKIDPQNITALSEKGSALLSMGYFEKSLEYLNKTLEINPKSFSTLLNKGIALEEQGKLQEALAFYKDAFSLNSKDPLLLSQLGSINLKLERYKEALKYIDDSLIINPQNPSVIYNKGIVYSRLGYFKEAISLFDLCLNLEPAWKEVWKSKGQALTDAGEHEAGLACFEEALRIDSNYIDSLISKVKSLNSLGHYKEAIEEAKKALETDKDQLPLYIETGFSYFNMGMYKEALDSFNTIIEKNPKYVKAIFHKGLSLEKLGRFEEAAKCFDVVTRESPLDITSLHHFGYNLARLGRHRDAIEILDEALLLSPNNHEILYLKGYSLAELGRYKEALQFFNKALDLNPAHLPSVLSKGKTLAHKGQWNECLKYYKIYYEKDPGNFQILAEMGKALAQLNRHKDAVFYYDKSLDIQPKNSDVLALKVISLEKLEEYEETAKLLYRILKNTHKSDKKRAFFEFKYDYLSKYKREIPNKKQKQDDPALEIHDLMINNLLNDFWKEEIDNYTAYLKSEEKLQDYLTGKTASENNCNREISIYADINDFTMNPVSGGLTISHADKTLLINPGIDFINNITASPHQLFDFNAVIITRHNPFNHYVIERFFEMLGKARHLTEKKSKTEYSISIQQKISSLLREKESNFEEIQKLIQSGYDFIAGTNSGKIDFFISPEIYKSLSNTLSINRDFTGNIHLLDNSENLAPFRYSEGIKFHTFAGKAPENKSEPRQINLIVSINDKNIIISQSLPEKLPEYWDDLPSKNTILISTAGSIKRDDFDISKNLYSRLPPDRTGFTGISVLSQIFKPELIVIYELQQPFSKHINQICRVISLSLARPCVYAGNSLKISYSGNFVSCAKCTNEISFEEIFSYLKSQEMKTLNKEVLFCETCRHTSN